MQCEKTAIRVNIDFDRPFFGMVFSKGHFSDPNCVHLQSGSGATSAVFEIELNECGMTSSGGFQTDNGQPNPAGSFIESTIIVQYDSLVQEVWDQARKLRCTWYDYYEKSVTFRPFQVRFLAFSANFCPIKIDLSGNTVWPKSLSVYVSFEVFHFGFFSPIFVRLKSTCLATLFNLKIYIFNSSSKWTIFGMYIV